MPNYALIVEYCLRTSVSIHSNMGLTVLIMYGNWIITKFKIDLQDRDRKRLQQSYILLGVVLTKYR
jgi:hypothetical protein